MNYKPNARKLVQVSEEAQRPVHVPVVLGNEFYIITQQDVRRIEDMRLLSYSKLTPNGQLIPMEMLGHDGIASEAIFQAYNVQQQQQQQLQPQNSLNNNMSFGQGIEGQLGICNLNSLAGLVGRIYDVCRKTSSDTKIQEVTMSTMSAHTPPTLTTATLEQQLQWAKANPNSSAPYPLTYSTGTSTSELTSCERFRQSGLTQCCHCCCRCKCQNSRPQAVCTTRACNTMDVDDDDYSSGQQVGCGGGTKSARQQLKQKKMSLECSYIS